MHSTGASSQRPEKPPRGTSDNDCYQLALDDYFNALCELSQARARLTTAKRKMKLALGVGATVLVAGVIGEVAVLQATSDPIKTWGPFVVPIVMTIVGYGSFHASFKAHQKTDEAQKQVIHTELKARVTHDVLDAHLTAIRGDIGGLKHGQERLETAVGDIAVSVGRIEGNLRQGGSK